MRVYDKRSAFLTLASLLLVATASADTVDQSFTSPFNMTAALNECCPMLAQTYTAGLNGTLTGVNLDLYSNIATDFSAHPLVVSIYSVAGGVPNTLLTSTTLPAGFSPGISTLITFPSAIAQVAGTMYAIVVSVPTAPPGGSGGYWTGACCGTDQYTGGQGLMLLGGNWVLITADADLGFQTHVNVVPEPGTLALVGTGLVAALVRRRKRGLFAQARG